MQVFVNPEMNILSNSLAKARLNSSISFNSDAKDRLSDVLSDLEQDLNTSRNNIGVLNRTGSLRLTNDNYSNMAPYKDPLTINPILNNSNGANGNTQNVNCLNSSSTPVLMTPDAFSNTPRYTRY